MTKTKDADNTNTVNRHERVWYRLPNSQSNHSKTLETSHDICIFITDLGLIKCVCKKHSHKMPYNG